MMNVCSGINTNNHLCRHITRATYVVFIYVLSLTTTNAQSTTLGRVSGLTEQQQRTGDAVQTVCIASL